MSLNILFSTLVAVPFDPLAIVLSSCICARLGWTKIVGYNGLVISPFSYWTLNLIFGTLLHLLLYGVLFLSHPDRMHSFVPWIWFKTVGGFGIWFTIWNTLQEANSFGFVGFPLIALLLFGTLIPFEIAWFVYIS